MTTMNAYLIIAETATGYEPMGIASSVDEAREIVPGMLVEMAANDRPCPDRVVVWMRGYNGMEKVAEI
jgi:hypothetical protein